MVAASEVEAIVSAKELMEMRKEAAAVHVEDSIYGYMVNIANASRTHADVSLGISPRGTMALSSMSKAHALMEGRDYVIPDDVLSVAPLHADAPPDADGRRPLCRKDAWLGPGFHPFLRAAPLSEGGLK